MIERLKEMQEDDDYDDRGETKLFYKCIKNDANADEIDHN